MILSFVMILFGYTLVSSIISVELDSAAHMRCIRFLSKTECDISGIRAVLTIGLSLISNGRILSLILLSKLASACLLPKIAYFLIISLIPHP
jgi:hypothetical protein